MTTEKNMLSVWWKKTQENLISAVAAFVGSVMKDHTDEYARHDDTQGIFDFL